MQRRPITFGTDGARGIANEGLVPEDALRLGLAAARLFGGPILICRDTRLSGGMLSSALAAGAASGGARVIDAGVLPTPGVAALAPRLGAAAAGVVSASHNPYPDNGIKFFSGEGQKLSGAKEREIEALAAETYLERPTRSGVGAVEMLDGAARLYVVGVLERLRPRVGGMKVLLDCANGAAYEGRAAGLRGVERSPYGRRRQARRYEHKRQLRLDAHTRSRRLGHDVAFAFDGDADRVLAKDEKGEVVDGDRIMAILARDLMERGALEGGVVVTVMSNLGFFKAMESMNIAYEVTPVGDRYVAEAMSPRRAVLGGEQSGHVILSEHVTTGDGLVTALALLDVMARSGRPLSELAEVMEVYPQELINVAVADAASAKTLASSAPVGRAVSEAEERLGEEGRILLRPSGTEPVVRVMVEHADQDVCREVCEEVARVVGEAEVRA